MKPPSPGARSARVCDVPWSVATTSGGPWPFAGLEPQPRRAPPRRSARRSSCPSHLSMRPQSSASQSPVAPRLAAARSRARSAVAPRSRGRRRGRRRSAARSLRSIGASPGVVGDASPPGRARSRAPRAPWTPAPTSEARQRRPAPSAEPRPAPPHARRASSRSRGRRRVRPATTSSSGRAAQTIVSAPSTASFAENSVVHGAISSVASRPTDTAYTRRPRGLSGIVRGSVIMKKRKTSTSGEVTSSHQRSRPAIGPRCHARGHLVPRRREHGDARRERQPEADRDPDAGAGARGSRARRRR